MRHSPINLEIGPWHESMYRMIRNGTIENFKIMKKAENGPLAKISSQSLIILSNSATPRRFSLACLVHTFKEAGFRSPQLTKVQIKQVCEGVLQKVVFEWVSVPYWHDTTIANVS